MILRSSSTYVLTLPQTRRHRAMVLSIFFEYVRPFLRHSVGSLDPANPAPGIPTVQTGLPRPPGPLSKPNSGGYSLKATLNWNDTLYKSVQVRITQIGFDWIYSHFVHRMAYVSYASSISMSEYRGKNSFLNQLLHIWKTLSERFFIPSNCFIWPSRRQRNFRFFKSIRGHGQRKILLLFISRTHLEVIVKPPSRERRVLLEDNMYDWTDIILTTRHAWQCEW